MQPAPEREPKKGPPDIAWTTDLGLTVASVCFPFRPGTVVLVEDLALHMAEWRTQDEQSVVSRFYNGLLFDLAPRMENMHASHSSKHGLCGSSYERSPERPCSRWASRSSTS